MDTVISIVIIVWFLGGFGWLARKWRQAVHRREENAELQHRRRVELELARQGLISGRPEEIVIPESGLPAYALPAAVIPAPPGAQPVHGIPGPCRHERIVPVIDDIGDLHKWICANTRCGAEFPPGTAIYEPGTAS